MTYPANVRAFLASIGLEPFADAFEANAIDLATLRDLTDADMRELGVTAMGPRKQLLAAIAALGEPAAAPPLPPAPSLTASHLDTLPTLLALPLAELAHEASPVLGLWAACDVAELSLKLVVMTGIAEHATGGRALPEALVRELRQRVELPTMGKWLGMALAVGKHAPPETTLPLAATSPGVPSLCSGRLATTHARQMR